MVVGPARVELAIRYLMLTGRRRRILGRVSLARHPTTEEQAAGPLTTHHRRSALS